MYMTPRDPKKWQAQDQRALENSLQNQSSDKFVGKSVSDCAAEMQVSTFFTFTECLYARVGDVIHWGLSYSRSSPQGYSLLQR